MVTMKHTYKSAVQAGGTCGNQLLSRTSMGCELSRVMYFLRIMHRGQYKSVTGQMSQKIWVQFLAGAEVSVFTCVDYSASYPRGTRCSFPS
jgi:hypothetical protein